MLIHEASCPSTASGLQLVLNKCSLSEELPSHDQVGLLWSYPGTWQGQEDV